MADQVTKTENLFDLEIFNKGSDADFVYTVYRFTANSRAAGEGISGRMHLIAQEEEDVKNPTTAITKFRNRIVAAIKEAKKLHQDLDFKLVGFNLKDGKLTGNSPIANSVKQISNAWEYGGSLKEDFVFNGEIMKALTTVSKCRKFAQDAKALKEQVEQRNKLFDEVSEAVKKEYEDGTIGVEPGSSEFKAEVLRRVNKLMSISNGEHVEDEEGNEPEDQWSEIGKQFAAELRKIAAFQGSDKQALAMAEARIKDVSQALGRMMASRSGLVKKDDTVEEESSANAA